MPTKPRPPCENSNRGCERLARANGPECTVCRSNEMGWKGRRPAEQLEYRVKLSLRSARMDKVIEGIDVKTKDRKVVAFRKRA